MSLPLLLLLATFGIANAETYTDYPPPPPAWEPVSTPPPPPPAWTDQSPPPPPPPAWTPMSSPPPPPPSSTPSPPPPPPSPSPSSVSPPPPPTPASTPVSPPSPPPPSSTPSPPPPPPTPAPPSVSPPPPPTPASTPVSPPPPPHPPAAWTNVTNVNSTEIRQVGQFAVHVYVLKWKVDLVFVNVVSGKTQPWDGGYNYRLVITVSGQGAKSPRYDVAVWGILNTPKWELRSFNPTK